MKKVISIMAAVICIIACNKTELSNGGNSLSALATIGNSTKTDYTDDGVGSGMKVEWAESESFKAYYSSSNYLTFNKNGETTFEAMDVPDDVRLVLYMPIGYPIENAPALQLHYDSKNIEDVVSYL